MFLSEDHVYHVKASGMPHIVLGTVMLVNLFIWFVLYPLQRKHSIHTDQDSAEKQEVLYAHLLKKHSTFYIRDWFTFAMLSQIVVCCTAIPASEISDADVGNHISNFILGIALLSVVYGHTSMAIDVMFVNDRKSAKKWRNKYIETIFGLLYMVVILASVTVDIRLGSFIAYGLLIIASGAFVKSLFILLDKAEQCAGYKEDYTVQLRFIIVCQVANLAVIIVLIFILTTEWSWILLFSGIFNYTTLTLLLESGILPVMCFVLQSTATGDVIHFDDDYDFNIDNIHTPKTPAFTRFDEEQVTLELQQHLRLQSISSSLLLGPVVDRNGNDNNDNDNDNYSDNYNDDQDEVKEQKVANVSFGNGLGAKDRHVHFGDNSDYLTPLAPHGILEDSISFTDRLRATFIPITYVETIMDNNNTSTHILIYVEAFRMLFYVLFWMFVLLAYIVSRIWADIPLSDNPLLDTFGSNSICIYFGYPPFTYIGSTLWTFVFVPMLFYQILDYFCVYHTYKNEQPFAKCFFIFYTILTLFETLSVIFIYQATSTTVNENLWIHSMPFILFGVGIWTLAYKKYVFFYVTGLFDTSTTAIPFPTGLKFGAVLYVLLLLVSGAFRIITMTPNLAGAEFTELEGMNTITDINSPIFFILVTLIPIVIQLIVASHLEPIAVIMNQKTLTWNKRGYLRQN